MDFYKDDITSKLLEQGKNRIVCNSYNNKTTTTMMMIQFEENYNTKPTTGTCTVPTNNNNNYNNTTNHQLLHRRKRRQHQPNGSGANRSSSIVGVGVGTCSFVDVKKLVIGSVLYIIVATSIVQTEAWLILYNNPFQFTSLSSFSNINTRRKLQTLSFRFSYNNKCRYHHHHVVRSTVKEKAYSFLFMNTNLNNINVSDNNKIKNDMIQNKEQQQQQTMLLPNCTSTTTILSDDANNDNNSDDVIKNSISAFLESVITSSSALSSASVSLLQKQQQSQQSALSKSNNLLVDVGSQITQSTCQLLGIKSIGIDYGLVRTGLAVTVGYEPKPLGILYNINGNTNNNNVTQLCNDIIQYIKSEQNVQQIIIGLPLHKNGTNSVQSTITIQFSIILYQYIIQNFGLSIRVVLFDERYTSKEAAARVHSKNPNISLYGILDADSACIILENYYNDNGIGEKIVSLSNTTLLHECLQYYYTNQQQQKEQQQLIQLQQLSKIQDRLFRIQQEKQYAISIQQQQLQQQMISTNDDTIVKKKKKKKKR